MQNNPNINIKNKPNDKPNVENQQIGTITPATADEKNICIKACPDAAVPLDFGKQSSAATVSYTHLTLPTILRV